MTTLKRPRRWAGVAPERGQVIIMVGLAAIIMFAIAGLAIDVGRMYATRAELGRAVDAAALAGILEFDGTSAGLTAGKAKAQAYLEDNEPNATGTFCVQGDTGCDTEANTMEVDATKSVKMFFLTVFGINSATVGAHAKAGFGTQSLDAVLVLDSTASMAGDPIDNAKEAASDFKDVLLGTGSSSNVGVGFAAFRGCYGRPSGFTSTAPMDTDTSDRCVRHDTSSSTMVTELINDATTLESKISVLDATGGSGTNVCGGVLKGWEVLDGNGNHQSDANNRRYMILLSDGDNNYNGAYSYQASLPSPHTYNSYSCMPPSSCSNIGGDGVGGCQDGLYVPPYTIASENFTSTTWNSGSSGWYAGWVRSSISANDDPVITSSGTPQGSYHMRIRGVGWACRAVDLSGTTGASVSYYAKRANWESSGSPADDALVRVSTSSCTTGLTTLNTLTYSELSTGYNQFTENLDAYAGSVVYIRFEGSMTTGTTDTLYVDSIEVEGGSSGSSNGYLNGANNNPDCDETPVGRERQLDMLTWDAAKAVEADDVEIFVVAFGVCSSNSTTYTDAQCDAQIGNTDVDNTGDQRLLKCIASSTDGTNDHYYYAATAEELPSIFTTIANQIAHRLIE